jgi:hypothetical protein
MKKIDPPVNTKVTIDPDTGARMFNQSWSSELKKKEPIQRKPVSRDTFVTEKKSVAKPIVKAKPSVKETTVKTSGERNFSEVISPKSAGVVKQGVEIKAPRFATPTKKEKIRMDIEKSKKEAFDKRLQLKKETFEKNQEKVKALGRPTQTWEQNQAEWKVLNNRTKAEQDRMSRMINKERRKNSREAERSGFGGGNSEKQRNSSACGSGCR